jgi:two-component system sensor histidine kinase/response regulator
VIDRNRMQAICNGDESLAIELITMLVDEAEPLIRSLQAQQPGANASVAHELAHSLKGIAGNVGASALRDVAARLETSTARGAPQMMLSAMVSEAATALDGVRVTLKAWEACAAGQAGIFG